MQEIDRQNAGVTDPVQFYTNLVSWHAQIDFDGVDSLLVEHLRKAIATNRRGRDLAANYFGELNKLRSESNEAQQVVGQLSGMADSPQQAAAASLLGGMVTAAAADEAKKKIVANYKPAWDAQGEAEHTSTLRAKELADLLTKKYGVPFIDAF